MNTYSIIISKSIPLTSVKEGIPVNKDNQIIGYVQELEEENNNLIAKIKLFEDTDIFPDKSFNITNEPFSMESFLSLIEEKGLMDLWMSYKKGNDE